MYVSTDFSVVMYWRLVDFLILFHTAHVDLLKCLGAGLAWLHQTPTEIIIWCSGVTALSFVGRFCLHSFVLFCR